MDEQAERSQLIRSIGAAVRSYEQTSYKPWRKNPRSFLNNLRDTETTRLRALKTVLDTHYLEHPLVQDIISFNQWDRIMLVHAHMEWVLQHPAEVQHLINRAEELRQFPGIHRDDDGWHPTLEAHLKAENEYHRHSGYRDHTRVRYMEDRNIISIVEDHATTHEYLIPYMNLRKWNNFDARNYAEYLEQQHALKDGWL
jgi:hypothetical protein